MKRFILAVAFVAAFLFAPKPATAQAQAGQEDITITDSSCTQANPCTVQIYQAAGACPASGIGSMTYTLISPPLLSSLANATSTAWEFADSTPVPGQTYCYYSTVTYASGGAPSAPSPTFTAVIPLPALTPPNLSGVWVPAT